MSLYIVGAISTSWALPSLTWAQESCRGVYQAYHTQLPLPAIEGLYLPSWLTLQKQVDEVSSQISSKKAELARIERELRGEIEAEWDEDGYGYGGYGGYDEYVPPTRYRKVSEEEKATLTTQKNGVTSELAIIEAKKAKLVATRDLSAKQAHDFALKFVKEAKKNPLVATAIQDRLSFYSLKLLAKDKKVTVLTGNSEKRLYQPQMAELISLIRSLRDKNFHILYDGDSAYAPLIAKLSGELGIAIVAKEEGQLAGVKNRVAINNDYLRMEAFTNAQQVIVTPDSTVGLGLLMDSRVSQILDTKKTFDRSSLSAWEELLRKDRNLGIKFTLPKIAAPAQDIFINSQTSYGSTPELKSVPGSQQFANVTANDLSLDLLKSLMTDSLSFARVMAANNGTGGSVFFGSGKKDAPSTELTFASAYFLSRLGFAVFTGGAGGAMETANQGAFIGGGLSVGVPLGGKAKLATEKDVMTAIHDRTIMTGGYDERIPGLLGEGADARRLIIFAPGGNGTLKELATTLVRASSKLDSFERLIFLDDTYYGPLVNWLMASALPQTVKDKITLIHSKEEILALGLKLQTDVERSRVRPERPPK